MDLLVVQVSVRQLTAPVCMFSHQWQRLRSQTYECGSSIQPTYKEVRTQYSAIFTMATGKIEMSPVTITTLQTEYVKNGLTLIKAGRVVEIRNSGGFQDLPAGTATTIAVLPVGFRPAGDAQLVEDFQDSAGYHIRVFVRSTGSIVAYNYNAPATGLLNVIPHLLFITN